MSWKPRALDQYTSNEIEKVGKESPAFFRYQEILKKTPESFDQKLRRERNEIWCQLVAETFIHNAHPKDICYHWSKTADSLIEKAWDQHGLNQKALCCFALGKLGSQELNLSSDIDIVIISTEPCPPETEAKVRDFTRSLSDQTEFGFCFRVDFDLRPGGRFGPVVPSLSRTEDHYWTQGQTWERLALVRARPLCGDQNLITDVQTIFEAFTYRKYINYSLFEDLKSLRSDIFEFRPPKKENKIHLKLMDGGIRDIELFVHALQIIHGGRIHPVRARSTNNATKELIQHQCADPDDLNFLIELYWKLRDLENRSQAKEDSQTHLSFANKQIEEDAKKAANIVSEILGTIKQIEGLPHSAEEQRAWLENLGYSEDSSLELWSTLVNLTARSSRVHEEEARRIVLKLFVEKIAKGPNPDLGLYYLCDFFKAVRAKSSFFSLLLHERKLIDDLASLFSTSPALSQIFVNRPELLDSFLFNVTDLVSTETAERLEELFETKLLSDVRLSMDFLRNENVISLEKGLSSMADKIFAGLLEHLKIDLDSNLEVLKMGKWAGHELGLKSDLDLVMLTPGEVSPIDYKLARRLISRVTENHRGGHFYEIDLRLRPTGSAGPLIMSEANLIDYLSKSAEPWERQAYLRVRYNPDFEKQIRQIIYKRGFEKSELSVLKDIRLKLFKTHSDQIDLKYEPGGLLDIEFSAQIAAIQNKVEFSVPSTRDLLEALGESELAQTYNRLRCLEQSLHLLTQRGTSLLDASDPDRFSYTKSLISKASERLKALDPIWSS